MIVPLQEVPLPEVDRGDVRQLAGYLGQMTRESIPGFVMHDAGPDMVSVIDRLRPVFTQLGYTTDPYEESAEKLRITTTREILANGQEVYIRDTGLHADGWPGEALAYNMHLTTIGEAKASLLEQTPAQLKKDRQQDQREKLPPGTRELFKRQMVDDEVLQSTSYVAHLRYGSLLVFRLFGRAPLAHDFRTLVAPRVAEVDDLLPPRASTL